MNMKQSFIHTFTLTASLLILSVAGKAQLASARVDQIAREQKVRYQQSGHSPVLHTLNPGNLNQLPSATVSTGYIDKKKKATPKPISSHPAAIRTTRDLPSNSPDLAKKGHPQRPRKPLVN